MNPIDIRDDEDEENGTNMADVPDWVRAQMERRSRNEKVLYFIRHAQSEANLAMGGTAKNMALADSVLTPEGISQAEELKDWIKLKKDDVEKIGVVLVSPLRRAIQTANYGLRSLRKPFVLQASLRESYWGHVANRGVPDSSLEDFIDELECANLVDVDSINYLDSRQDRFWQPEEEDEKTNAELNQRTDEAHDHCLEEVMKRPESHIAMVTHGGLLFYQLELQGTPNCGIWKAVVSQSQGSKPIIETFKRIWAPSTY